MPTFMINIPLYGIALTEREGKGEEKGEKEERRCGLEGNKG